MAEMSGEPGGDAEVGNIPGPGFRTGKARVGKGTGPPTG